MTEYLVLAGGADDADAISRTAASLARGGVVAVPTDTVYGLACRSGFPDAVRRIFALKGRPAEKALPWLVPDSSSVFSFVNAVPPRAARLMDAFWPGPLTIVLGEDDATVALRMPANDALREILRRAGGPVVATSANRSGSGAALSAIEVRAAFGDALDVVLDGGLAPLGRESTIVQVKPDGAWALLRSGGLPESALRPVLATRVVFVCTGNTCRSPMAALALTHALAERVGVPPEDLEQAGFVIRSAGLFAAPGSPASAGAAAAAQRAGFDLEAHRAAQVTRDQVASADFVFALSSEHLASLRRLAGPSCRAELLDPSGGDVPDPFGASDAVYASTFHKLQRLVAARLPEVQKHGQSDRHKKS